MISSIVFAALFASLSLAVAGLWLRKKARPNDAHRIKRADPPVLSHVLDSTLFIYDARTNQITIDEQTSANYGFERTMDLNNFIDRLCFVYPECDADRIQSIINKMLSSHITRVWEFPVVTRSTHVHWIKLSLMPYGLNVHKTTDILGSLIDVTVSHEAFTKKTEIFDRMPCGIHWFCLNEPFHTEYINAGLYKLLGYTPDECMESAANKRYIQAIHEEDREVYEAFTARLSTRPSIDSCEYRLVCKNGSLIMVSDTMESILTVDGIMYGYSAIFDITQKAGEHAEAEVLLKQCAEKEALLLKERAELLEAAKITYDMIVSVDLTHNTCHVIDNKYQNINLEGTHTFDKFVNHFVRFIPDSGHAIAYRETFRRNLLLEAYNTEKKRVLLRHTLIGKDNAIHWVDTMVVFVCPQLHDKNVIGLMLVKVVDEDQRRIEKVQTLQQKESLLHDELMENCAIYAEINLTTGFLIGDVLDYTRNGGPYAFKLPAELDPPGYIDTLAQWWAEHKIVSDKESFLRQCNRDSFLAQYNSGKRYIEIHCQKRDALDEVRMWKLMFFFSSNEITGDVIAVCVTNDITEKEENERKIKQLTNELQESRIKTSMGQMQPHFLYNALGSIREVILSDPQYASDLIYDFSTHLRACIQAMSDVGNNLIPISKEMENVQAFVNIEKMRFGERLRVEYDLCPDCFSIVPLSIQPLVENAIRHGIQPKGKEGGTVSISTRVSDNANIIIVKDDGVGFDYNAIHGSIIRGERDSTGLENLIFRLEKVLNAKVHIESQPGHGTDVVVAIPKENI